MSATYEKELLAQRDKFIGIIKQLRDGISPNLADIADERLRQIHEEGFQPEHDDEHIASELVHLAVSYALPPALREHEAGGAQLPRHFPHRRLRQSALDQIESLRKDLALRIDQIRGGKPRAAKPEDEAKIDELYRDLTKQVTDIHADKKSWHGFDPEWFKPMEGEFTIEKRKRELIKAAALILAELDRLDREAAVEFHKTVAEREKEEKEGK